MWLFIVIWYALLSFADNTPPSFNSTCPNNMVFYVPECSSTALLSWNESAATDNSGHVSISYPAIRPPVNLSIGLYNILYSATDSSGNRANCTFFVQVASKSVRWWQLFKYIIINYYQNYHYFFYLSIYRSLVSFYLTFHVLLFNKRFFFPQGSRAQSSSHPYMDP